jgi:DNA-binding MarR family transcriptional regulator
MDLDQLERVLALFAVLDPQMPLHFLQAFVLVAAAPEGSLTYREIEEKLSLTNSSVSRTLNALGERHRKGDKGHGLIEVFIDPGEGRRYRARLTKRGRALASQITPPPPHHARNSS